MAYSNPGQRRAAMRRRQNRNRHPSIHKYLGSDETYQQQMSALQADRELFQTSNRRDRRNVKTDFRKATDRMGDQRKDDLKDILADYAARGIGTSGLLVDANRDYNKDYQEQLGDLGQDRTRNLFSMKQAMQQNNAAFRAQVQSARLEALRRRAARYGLTGGY